MAAHPTTKKKIVTVERQIRRAGQGDMWDADGYPITLLEPHLTRRRPRRRWVDTEITQLQFTFTNMADFA